MADTKQEYQKKINERKQRIKQLQNEEQRIRGEIRYIIQEAKEDGFQIDFRGNVSQIDISKEDEK